MRRLIYDYDGVSNIDNAGEALPLILSTAYQDMMRA